MSKQKSYVVTASFETLGVKSNPYVIWSGEELKPDYAMLSAINSPGFKSASNVEANPDSKTKYTLHVYQVAKEKTYTGEES